MSKNDNAITSLEISKLIPVDEWFDKALFMKLTGIVIGAAASRLARLVKQGAFSSKKGTGRSFVYKMSAEQRLSIANEEDNKLREESERLTEAQVLARAKAKRKEAEKRLKSAAALLKKAGLM